ncbi:MAG TPA: NBR1-Ig-like domain-containing protein [Brevefilum fermentans]|jgi:hypothetical protein|uniref:Nbr1 FW domain-containing protein n=1 Tax=Candidatus Brevifilum fermentans TaxID=1986204 RepID=A0A1Y6K818_9CHLR|nr:NBR1-Ig-like domain-containing protein [Brevefilum fermentans]MDI9567173.1 NBR1-Ig-like domain-containing protein [Chloroflexota bacterium]OQB82736.1 MAG: hypothetical protein BWX85_01517 [Chloroflexi bacterium ADurb.Bin120]SMX55028.1 exported protein of unknown function [Brevefilum fermentans]HOM66593.1 NBR1-Ig-like domain-containing protein [Brevefilum fermentans]HQA29089.1 NBR1-Ig-like domain-containing protein [Brevefilum fermentans]
MLKRIKKHILVLSLIISLGSLLSACKPAEPKLDVNAQKTGFVLTAEVQASMTAAARPTATETPIPEPSATATVLPSNTPILLPTKTTEGTTPATGVDRAQIIAQEPEDNTRFAPGETFTVTWTLENTGTSTWTTQYYIEYASGESLGAEDKVYIWLPVSPETSLALTVNMVAPSTPGNKISYWKMYNASGDAFYDFNITITVGE